LAALFGASREFDAFVTAFRIPNLLRDLFAEGALSAAFVTSFSKKLSTDGDRAAWRLANLVLNALLVVLSVITLLGVLAAPWLVNLIAPGFKDIPGKTELTVMLTRVMFPFLLLMALAALAMGMLNAKHRFGIPASASMMFNIGSIVGGVGFALLFAPDFLHDSTHASRAMIGMSIGTLIGGAAQWLIQIPSLFRVGYRYQPILDWRDEDFRKVLRLLGPSVLGVAAVQINVFVDNWFASFFGDGAVTWLNCAFRLMQFPIGMFGVAISVATLPTVSAHVVSGDISEFRKTLGRSLRLTLFLCIPAACGLAVLAEPIVSVIYQHGRFDAYATEQTVWCLRAFAVGLAGYAAIKVIAPTFYAFGDSRTPALVALLSVVIHVVFNYVFAIVLGLGTAGLALSTSVVALTNFTLLLTLLRRKIQRIELTALADTTMKVLIASALMCAGAIGALWTLTPGRGVFPANRYVALAGAMAAALFVFFACCKLLRVGELEELMGALRRKK
jgi:putative peptidoglycan lipid II flippase